MKRIILTLAMLSTGLSICAKPPRVEVEVELGLAVCTCPGGATDCPQCLTTQN